MRSGNRSSRKKKWGGSILHQDSVPFVSTVKSLIVQNHRTNRRDKVTEDLEGRTKRIRRAAVISEETDCFLVLCPRTGAKLIEVWRP